ncbi:MAG: GNAT family N-acetyltransferase [Bacteroidota bacterium]
MTLIINEVYSLRPLEERDWSFLKKVYASTRENEMKMLSHWTAEMIEAFVNQQFEAQHFHYQKFYIGADFWVIYKDDLPIGRLYFHENHEENNSRIIDISILPEYRNKGIGRKILTDILSQAQRENKKVSIHVEAFNPAMKLYESLGFEKISETNGVNFLFEWKPKY